MAKKFNLIEHVFKFCVNNHSCVNTAAQYGAIAALDGPEDHLIKKIGTPTMGGVVILFGLIASVLLWADLKNVYILFL